MAPQKKVKPVPSEVAKQAARRADRLFLENNMLPRYMGQMFGMGAGPVERGVGVNAPYFNIGQARSLAEALDRAELQRELSRLKFPAVPRGK